jgi:hypothetical protein
LAGNVLDELDDVADLLRHVCEPGNVLVGRGGVGRGRAHDLVGLTELAADFLDRNRKLRRGRGRGFHIRGSCI